MQTSLECLFASLNSWLSGVEFDPAASTFRAPREEFVYASEIRNIMSLIAVAPDPGVTTFSMLLSMLKYVVENARSDHPLASELSEFVEHYEFEARTRTRFGLGGISEQRYQPISEAPFFVPIVLGEVFQNLVTLMQEFGFFNSTVGPRKQVIVVHGRYRTGSTRTLGALRSILQLAEQAYVVIASDFRQVDKHIACFKRGAYAGKWLLIKSHNWMPIKADPEVRTFYTKRNLADVAASAISLWRRTGEPADAANLDYMNNNTDQIINEIGLQKILNDYVVPSLATEIIQYEDYHNRESDLIQNLADTLGLCLDEEGVRVAAKQIDPRFVKNYTDKMSLDYEDMTTLLRARHIGATLGAPCAQLDLLPQKLIEYLKAIDEWPLL